ncbi:MAG: FG-GAP-like repeat-containing protein [Planctomycetota bacterium]|nr:FG-GAP-like repeat-containing protein [Planctomycetota bacterium]
MKHATLAALCFASLLACNGNATAQFVEDLDILVMAESDEHGDFFGWYVTPLSDANGDGVTDFAVARTFLGNFRGGVTVYSGADGSEIWTYCETEPSAITGFSLGVIDDINGDGVDEVVAGAPFAFQDITQVYVFSGADGVVLHSLVDAVGESSFGYAVATQGDFNGDGVEDLVFGATGVGWPVQTIGEVFIHSADDFSLIQSISPPLQPAWRFGTGLAFLGDIDGKPGDELAIGSRYDQNGPGRIQVFSYAKGGATLLYSIENVDLGGPFDGDRIDSGQDYNGDGFSDIFMGERLSNRVRIFSGLDGTEIMTINGPKGTSFGSGRMIEDIDGDGQADLIIGGLATDGGGVNSGRASLYSGADGSLIRQFTATEDNFLFGIDAVPFGDLNGDGALDFLVAAVGSEADNLFGAAFVIAGEPVVGETPGDLDGDGMVGILDLLILLSSWGPCPDPPQGCPADLDGDGTVGIFDLLVLLSNWR